MGDRIERQAAEHLGRPVAQAIGRVGVGELVNGKGDQQEDRDQDDLV